MQQSFLQINTDSIAQSQIGSDSLFGFSDTLSFSDSLSLPDSLSLINTQLNDTLTSPIISPENYSNFFHTSYDGTFTLLDTSISLGLGQFFLMLFITLMLGFLNLFFAREAIIIVVSPFKNNGLRKLQEEDSLSLKRSMMLMLLIFVFVVSVFVYEIFNYLDVHFSLIPNIPFFLEVFLLISIMASFRLLSSKLIGHVFDLDELAASYNYRLLIINCLTGLILIPFMVGMRLSPESLIPLFAWTGIGVLLILYTVGLAVGADLSWRSDRISKYHLFLYFCTLEIAPFIVLFKALSSLN